MTGEDGRDPDDRLAAWLAAYADALGGGGAAAPDRSDLPPDLRPRADRAVAGLRLLSHLRPGSTAPPPCPTADPRPPATAGPAGRPLPWSALGRFRLRRELGRGSFGIVYLAFDPLLNRDVALKVLRAEAAVSPDLRHRFRREARAASALDHPNVVPVYEAGEVGPVCFLVTAYCPGITLAEWLCGRAAPVPFPRAAQLVATLAEAVHHAHGRGVVHRDLKPSNVLLDAPGVRPEDYGTPKITDFGLAKHLAAETADAASTAPTRAGAILGTPCYMAPEQAGGTAAPVGPAADVYGLGAILYELLTGRPPFRGDSDLDTILQLQSADPVPTARLRKVPRDLETVCLKCLQKDPADRYASAQELADDLRRFLADRVILARRPTWPQRLGKWARRHRGVVATGAVAAALLVATTVAALAVGLVQVNREQDRTRAALEAEGRRRQQARDALDAMTSLTLEDLLARQPTLTDEHRRFLNRALQAYEEFAADTAGDEASRHGAARALANVGRIRFRLDRSPEGADIQRRAVARFEQLAADYPGQARYRRELALAHRDLGRALDGINRPDEARAALSAAVAVGGRLVADHPDVPDYQGDQALNHFYLGQLGASTPQEAMTAFRKAIALLEPLVAQFPGSQDYRETLALTEAALSSQLASAGAPAQDVVSAVRRSIAIFQKLGAESPGNAKYRLALAQSDTNLANRLRSGGQVPEAERAYRDALALFRGLAEEFPAVPQHRLELATCLMNLGSLLKENRRASEAEPNFHDALAVAKRLVEDYPKVLAYRSIRGAVSFNLGLLYRETGRLAQAEKYLGDALAVRRELVDVSDTHPFRYSLAHTLVGLADLRRAQKQPRAGVELLQQAVPHHRAALKAQPRNPSYRRSWCDNRRLLADSLLDLGDHEAAAAAVDEFAAAATEVANDDYRAACRLARCAGLAAADNGLPEGSRARTADDYARRAVEYLRKAVRSGFNDLKDFETNADLHALRTRADFQELLAELHGGRKD